MNEKTKSFYEIFGNAKLINFSGNFVTFGQIIRSLYRKLQRYVKTNRISGRNTDLFQDHRG